MISAIVVPVDRRLNRLRSYETNPFERIDIERIGTCPDILSSGKSRRLSALRKL